MTLQIQRGVSRLDAGGTLRRPRRNAAGFLEVDAYLSRTGVYGYEQEDGSTLYELREEADVFSPEVLAGFASVPVTREHPPGMVTPENARMHMRGIIQNEAWKDGDKAAGTLVIHDAELAGEVEREERTGVSPGYLCDVEPAPEGLVVEGKPIHGIQRRIRINHVAVCMYPRGGDSIRVRLDGLAPAGQDGRRAPTSGGNKPPGEEATMTTRRITIDGISGDVPPQIAEAWERHEKSQEALRKDSATSFDETLRKAEKEAGEQRARADSLAEEKRKVEEKAQKLDAELQEAKSPKARAAEVKARVALETTARAVLGKTVKMDGQDTPLSDLTEKQLRVAVLQKRIPGFKLDSIPKEQLDGYLVYRFDEEASKVERETAKRSRQDADASAQWEEEGAEPMADADMMCPRCKGEKMMDGETCPECNGSGAIAVYSEDEDETADGSRQDSREREPYRIPAKERRDGARSKQDAKSEYLANVNTVGMLPSQRPNANRR